MPHPIIDVHTHPLLPTYRRRRLDSDQFGGPTDLILGKECRQSARAMNKELAEIVARAPKRIGASAVVPLDDMDAALAETAYALDVLGLDGIGAPTHFDLP
ncbi:MAG: amidohydrolase family protein [Steroidobacteraceae bacterium]